jgi:predicted DCC family thiol-disulfide oxidoreductase YuxK
VTRPVRRNTCQSSAGGVFSANETLNTYSLAVVGGNSTCRGAPRTPTTAAPVLVYDGDCRFCKWCVRFLVRRTRRPLECVAYQTADLKTLGLTREQCELAVQWVSLDGQRYSANLAAAAALRNARLPYPLLGVLLNLPGVRNLAASAYGQVARRRRCAAPKTAR